MLKQNWMALLIGAVALAACAAPATASPAPSGVRAPTESPAPRPTALPTDAGPTRDPDPFHPSDPAAVNLAAGRPQLVEFFAFW
jgi:hypothetical protein